MILKECRDWISAVEDCFPRSKSKKLRDVLEAVSRGEASGRWEIGLSSPHKFQKIHMRYFGGNSNFKKFKSAAAALLDGSEARSAPPRDFPWLSFNWDPGKDIGSDFVLYSKSPQPGQAEGFQSGGGRILLKPKPFLLDLLGGTPLVSVFAELSELFPLKEIVTQWDIAADGGLKGREDWSLRFKSGVPWRRFICSNMADSFLGEYSYMAYLLLDRRVTELSFEGGGLRAYLD